MIEHVIFCDTDPNEASLWLKQEQISASGVWNIN